MQACKAQTRHMGPIDSTKAFLKEKSDFILQLSACAGGRLDDLPIPRDDIERQLLRAFIDLTQFREG